MTQRIGDHAVTGVKNARSPQFRYCGSPEVTLQANAEKEFGGSGLAAWRLGRRNRAGAGAGATPVFVAASRHETSLARFSSLVGRSRPCPYSRLANRPAIRTAKTSST